jgi:site-specific recombinase XerC
VSPRTDIILSPAPASLFAPTPKAAQRVLEFFTTQINNDHTRKSYLNATRRFAEWCELHRLHQLADVQPFHVAAFVKDLQGHFSTPTVKQHLAAISMLFDWLVTGHVIDVNPAHAVRGPRAARLHRHQHAHRAARSRPDWLYGLYLRPRERRHQHEGEGLFHAR